MSTFSRNQVASLLIPVLPLGRSGTTDIESHRAFINEALELGVGGFKIIGGDQDAVRALAKELQQRAPHPLLLAADMESGAGQQFTGATGLPPLAAIAALGDMESLRRAARLTAREARTMGVNWNHAPVADLDFDVSPILGVRALGRDPRKVATLVTAWIEACQAEGVLACVKHFPGLGRTSVDPNAELPVIDVSADVLKDNDLVPFRAAISTGVASMMTAHAAYPALDSSREPATLSREIIQWTLRQQFKYDNLIVTDAMTMAALSNGGTRSPAESTVLAIRAGCDVVLDPGDLIAAADAIIEAVESDFLSPERVRNSIRRRLKWAQWASPPNDWRRPSGADTAWGALLADRVLRIDNGPLPPLSGITEVVIVDDDADADVHRHDRHALLEAMRHSGTDARLVDAPGALSQGPVVIALYAGHHPKKGRTKLLPSTVQQVTQTVDDAKVMKRSCILLALADPRFVPQLEIALPTVIAWSGDRVMQQAAARAMQRVKR